MTIKTTLLATTIGIAALITAPVEAGGPIIVPEEPPIADVRPQGDGGNWVVPVVGVLILCAILCGDSDDPAPPVVADPDCYRKCK
jgi:hypothetical protein